MNHPVLEVVETIVLLSPADEPWRRIGRFDDMSWHPAIAGLEMLDGAASDAGARRRLTTADGGQLVECLVEHDMAGRTYRYRMETSPLPLTDYDSTISVEALAKGGSRVCWRSTFRGLEGSGLDDEAVRAIVAGIYRAGLDALPTAS